MIFEFERKKGAGQLVFDWLDKCRLLFTSNANRQIKKVRNFIRLDELQPHPLRSLTYRTQHVRAYDVEASWNVTPHAQKPDFVFWRNGRVHLNRRGASVQSTTGSRDVNISGSNAGYTMFRGSVKGTGYPLHSPVSPSLPLPCVIVCHHISTGVYIGWKCT
jgi:hypothetical protein